MTPPYSRTSSTSSGVSTPNTPNKSEDWLYLVKSTATPDAFTEHSIPAPPPKPSFNANNLTYEEFEEVDSDIDDECDNGHTMEKQMGMTTQQREEERRRRIKRKTKSKMERARRQAKEEKRLEERRKEDQRKEREEREREEGAEEEEEMAVRVWTRDFGRLFVKVFSEISYATMRLRMMSEARR